MWTSLSSRRKSNIKKRRKANCRDKGEEEGGITFLRIEEHESE